LLVSLFPAPPFFLVLRLLCMAWIIIIYFHVRRKATRWFLLFSILTPHGGHEK
jgi:hypothetical protein